MNIRQARKKIRSVSNVKKITKAMQLVSAIKMKKAQQLAIEGKPYQYHLEYIIEKILKRIDQKQSILLAKKNNSINKDLAIVISSNKGLCGGFNMNLFRFILKNSDIKNTDFIIIGKKAELIGKLGGKIIADYSSNVPLESVSALFNLCLKYFLNGDYSHVYIYFNSFISTLKVKPTRQILFPFQFSSINNTMKELNTDKSIEYLIEPSPEEIIDSLLRSFAQQKIQYAIIQSEAGEHSSRMIAMKNATDNANDVIFNLTMLRNKLRQEKITNELLDMVTAKESVESS